jgi:hypothetical protein
MKDALDEARRFGAGQADFAMHDVGEIRPRQSPGVGAPDRTRVGHIVSLPPR